MQSHEKRALMKSCFTEVMWFLCRCSGWIQREVNHLCFPPSHHLLVVDAIVWLTAILANERLDWCLCGVAVQSRSRGRGWCGWGGNRAEAAAADLTAVWSSALSCDYDDSNGQEWTLKSPLDVNMPSRSDPSCRYRRFVDAPRWSYGSLCLLGRTGRQEGAWKGRRLKLSSS